MYIFYTSVSHHSACIKLPRGAVNSQIVGLMPKILIQKAGDGAREFASLTNSWELLLLLVWGPYLGNHCSVSTSQGQLSLFLLFASPFYSVPLFRNKALYLTETMMLSEGSQSFIPTFILLGFSEYLELQVLRFLVFLSIYRVTTAGIWHDNYHQDQSIA